jgi:hypothetical protein
VKHWEIIAENLSKAGWSWGCVATVHRQGRTIWIADAHRDDGQRFVVHADCFATFPRARTRERRNPAEKRVSFADRRADKIKRRCENFERRNPYEVLE